MADISKRTFDFFRNRTPVTRLSSSPRMRKTGLVLLILLALYTLFGVFGVPPILRRVLTGPVAASLHRPVGVGRISFNPYRLLLNVDQLQIGEREGPDHFVDLGHLRVKVSWSSILHLAPILYEVQVDRPAIHVVRTAEQQFNFSDLIAPGPPPKPGQPPSKPFKFAVSNVQLNDGDIRFDDKVLNQVHRVEHIKIGVPFIANLSSAVNVFVQPFLYMVVDGSPLRLTGNAKPFAVPMESDLDLNIHKLDLARYLSYVPRKLPIKMPSGSFSCLLQIRFVNAPTEPSIKIGGVVALDKIDVRDESNAPLVGLEHFVADLNEVEPLRTIAHFGKIRMEGFSSEIVRKADGTTNFTALAGGGSPPAAPAAPGTPQAPPPASAAGVPPVAPQATPVSPAGAKSAPNSAASAVAAMTPVSTPAAPSMISAVPAAPSASTPAAEATPASPDISVKSFELVDSAIRLTDNSGPTPAILALQGIHVGLQKFHTIGPGSAPFQVNANLGGGGALAVKGALDLTQKLITSDVAVDQVDLPALQAFAQQALAATIASGKFSAHANAVTHFGTAFNVHAEPANVSVDNFKLNAPNGETPVQWNNFAVNLGQADLAARRATVTEVRSDGLHLLVERSHAGELNLLALSRSSAPPASQGHVKASHATERASRSRRSRHRSRAAPPAPAQAQTAPAGPVWQYTVGSVAMEKAIIQVEDRTPARPVKLAVAPLNIHLKDLSSDLSKPFTVDLDAIVNQKGNLKVTGTTAVDPLKANLRVITRRLDLAFADPYLAKQLNASIKNAELTMNGAVGLAKARENVQVGYRGDATLGNVRMLDRLTGDNFVRWSALSITRIDAGLGRREPKIHIGGIALANFYSRVILNRNGTLNLSDLTTNPQAAPKSLTRAQTPVAVQAAPAATPSPTSTPTSAQPGAGAQPAAPPAPHPINADIELGRITLQGGHVNYSDYFIQPNYTADLTEIGGKIGAFGTHTTTPADVALQGEINGSAPISINGSINPLAPMAFVDIGAKADGIELTNLTPYSTKYTGYPIVKGTLNLDVHYLLDKDNLTANNHIFIDQFTFGDRVESKDATNLPVRLAVALLKNSKGQIDLTIPVSGSLADPHFSIGSVIWEAFKNLIVKAATSPFSLIGAAFGGGGQDLGYVEFAPGYALLTPDSIGRLTTVAKALKDRTGLRLGITGRVDPELDRPGLRDAKVDQLVQAQAEDSGVEAGANLSKDQYDKYLTKVYKAAKFPKPKDFVGLSKSLPPAEMKKLLVTNMEVTDQDLKQLADARANVVRQWMSKQIDPARLFVIAPVLDAKGISDKGKTTRVDLSLQ
jgi:hypothetical protein